MSYGFAILYDRSTVSLITLPWTAKYLHNKNATLCCVNPSGNTPDAAYWHSFRICESIFLYSSTVFIFVQCLVWILCQRMIVREDHLSNKSVSSSVFAKQIALFIYYKQWVV